MDVFDIFDIDLGIILALYWHYIGIILAFDIVFDIVFDIAAQQN
jgi:hypothetical protein